MGAPTTRRLPREQALSARALPAPVPTAPPFALAIVDEESFSPLADLAQEIGREFGADGMLITWHADSGEPVYLFADGVCDGGSPTARHVAEQSAWAARQGSGTRSHWRTLADDVNSGVLTTSIPAEHGVFTVSTFFRRIGRSTRLDAGETAARLLPLVQPFFRMLLSRLRSEAMARTLAAVSDDSGIGVIFLDHHGQTIFANSVAEHLLDRADGLRRKGLAVAGIGMTDTLRLHAAVEEVVSSVPARSAPAAGPLVEMHRSGGRSLMVAVAPNSDSISIGLDCAAILYVVDPDQDLQALISPACAFYRLSPVEARLATCLVQGLSLNEAAVQMGVREQTLRTYLKRVFLKTDTNRQVELVRLLILSAVRRHASA